MWELTRYALEFFHQHLPFTEMAHHDELTSAKDDYCLAKKGQIYVIYLPSGGTTKLDLGDSYASLTVRWYNPRTGGKLQISSVKTITGPGSVAIGYPPADSDKDWVALIKRQ
jgi:hypothetical protein